MKKEILAFLVLTISLSLISGCGEQAANNSVNTAVVVNMSGNSSTPDETNAVVANNYVEPPKKRTHPNPSANTGDARRDELEAMKNDIPECDEAVDKLIQSGGTKAKNRDEAIKCDRESMRLYLRLREYNDNSAAQYKTELTEYCKKGAKAIEECYLEK